HRKLRERIERIMLNDAHRAAWPDNPRHFPDKAEPLCGRHMMQHANGVSEVKLAGREGKFCSPIRVVLHPGIGACRLLEAAGRYVNRAEPGELIANVAVKHADAAADIERVRLRFRAEASRDDLAHDVGLRRGDELIGQAGEVDRSLNDVAVFLAVCIEQMRHRNPPSAAICLDGLSTASRSCSNPMRLPTTYSGR